MQRVDDFSKSAVIHAMHPDLGERWLFADGEPPVLFTDNETNRERLWNHPNVRPWLKDAFHRYVVDGDETAVNPEHLGTKAAPHYELQIAAGASATVRLRLSDREPSRQRGRVASPNATSYAATPSATPWSPWSPWSGSWWLSPWRARC